MRQSNCKCSCRKQPHALTNSRHSSRRRRDKRGRKRRMGARRRKKVKQQVWVQKQLMSRKGRSKCSSCSSRSCRLRRSSTKQQQRWRQRGARSTMHSSSLSSSGSSCKSHRSTSSSCSNNCCDCKKSSSSSNSSNNNSNSVQLQRWRRCGWRWRLQNSARRKWSRPCMPSKMNLTQRANSWTNCRRLRRKMLQTNRLKSSRRRQSLNSSKKCLEHRMRSCRKQRCVRALHRKTSLCLKTS